MGDQYTPSYAPTQRGRSGDSKTPDIPSTAPRGPVRGKYPKDGPGVGIRDTSRGGPSGDKEDQRLQPTVVKPQPPAVSPRPNLSDPTR